MPTGDFVFITLGRSLRHTTNHLLFWVWQKKCTKGLAPQDAWFWCKISHLVGIVVKIFTDWRGGIVVNEMLRIWNEMITPYVLSRSILYPSGIHCHLLCRCWSSQRRWSRLSPSVSTHQAAHRRPICLRVCIIRTDNLETKSWINKNLWCLYFCLNIFYVANIIWPDHEWIIKSNEEEIKANKFPL